METSPASLIADLDEALADAGETITLQHLTIAPNSTQIPFPVTCRAVVRGYSPEELIAGSGIIQKDRKIIMSPTEITAAGWPGPMPVGPNIDKRIPRNGDRVIRNGLPMIIQTAEGLYVQGTLVRIEAQARGN